MRIACVDKTATDRLKLEETLGQGFRECRKTIGHLLVAKFYPSSREEALINTPPDVLIVGPAFNSEEAFRFVREWKSLHSDVPVFIFASEENYCLKALKRFEPYVREVFCTVDKASRYVYSISSVSEVDKKRIKGALITVQGVKGGVGVTSVVGGLAHAYQELGKSIVVMDLSQRGVFSQFMLSDKWQSSELSEILAQKIIPDADKVERLLIQLKNGIQVLPPPSGAGEIREVYVRNTDTLEIPLYIVDRLLELYDVVLVDMAGTEGILPFALTCRADCRIILSGNDAGSVHLLASMISDSQSMGEGQTLIVINRLIQNGLNLEDVLDFITWIPSFDKSLLFSEEIPYDPRASLWIGTGNTIYTEGSKKIKNCLFALAKESLGTREEKAKNRITDRKYFGLIGSRKKREITYNKKENLPLLPLEILPVRAPTQINGTEATTEEVCMDSPVSDFTYCPPKKVANL